MKTNLPFIAGASVLILAGFFLGRCSPSDPHAHHDDQASGAAPVSTIWTCSMHPQIQQPESGDCPICGMDLIPLSSQADDNTSPRSLTLSESAKDLAALQTHPVERRFPEITLRLAGTLQYDETKIRSLTARFPARIDELYVNVTGIPVKKGDHLARIYSAELLAAQGEFLTAHRFDPTGAAARSAREKLLLWDLLPSQLDALLEAGEASDHFELKAPLSGIVVKRHVNEGDYLSTGQPLFRIVDLDTLWLRLDAYESDLTWLRIGQTVEFTVPAYPGQNYTGTIAFIEPELDPRTRTLSVRVNVPNTDRQLKPGMLARARVQARVAAPGQVYAPQFAGKWISPMHPEIVKDAPGQCDVCGMDLVAAESLGYVQDSETQAPLVIPASAVLHTGARSLVYVAVPDADRPTYEGRSIEVGPRAGSDILVTSGLEEGERVVTHGAFKIDSELQLRGKPSMMSPSDAENGSPPPAAPVAALPPELLDSLLPHYLALQKALANDDLASARSASDALHHAGHHSATIDPLLEALAAAPTLAAMRRPHFDDLSQLILDAVSKNADTLSTPLYEMSCPMVYPDRGASWLQDSPALRNPFFGATMLTCGETVRSLGDSQSPTGAAQ